MAAGGSVDHTRTSSNWWQIVTSFYPDALSKTYTVPPVHFRRLQHKRETIPGLGMSALVVGPGSLPNSPAPPPLQGGQARQDSLWTHELLLPDAPKTIQDNEVGDDFCQSFLLDHLQTLGKKGEVMFIVSQLEFGKYLDKPAYAAAAALLPNMPSLPLKNKDGEFDFLIIHRRYGILIAELKSVGLHPKSKKDATVVKRVQKAVKQLDQSVDVMRQLVKDIAPMLSVRATLFLPYVPSTQLTKVLKGNPALLTDVCRVLGAGSAEEAAQLCCCSDQLSNPESYAPCDALPPDAMALFSLWWQRRMACQEDPVLNDALYLDILARFVGPATSIEVHCSVSPRVEVRTDGQAVAELGRRLARLVLTYVQLTLLNRSPPTVFLTGPPGTGKTVMLVLQGLRWLREGFDVHVVSLLTATLAISFQICHQLKMTMQDDPPSRAGSVFHHSYDFLESEADVDKAVGELLSAPKGDRPLCVLLDESNFDGSQDSGRRRQKLVEELSSHSNLHLWTASVFDKDVPTVLEKQVLRDALRCAPVIQKEVMQGLKASGDTHLYSNSQDAAHSTGSVRRVAHSGGAHTGDWPHDCQQCGIEVARELRHLDVGSKGKGTCSYSDVFILTRSSELRDETETSAPSGVVLGLRSEGVPVCVLGKQDLAADKKRFVANVEDTAKAKTDRVTAAFYGFINGLERRVVVWLPGRRKVLDDPRKAKDIDAQDRLHAVSRCSTQLIWVDVPET